MDSESRPTAAFYRTLPIEGTDTLLQLEGEKLDFFRTTTGIQNVDVLKAHILAVQREAYAVRPYTCITYFYFTELRLSHVPGYERLLALGKARKNPIYIDVGCCFGIELRRAILDGYPRECVMGTDVIPEFWELGHKLFKTTPETFPVPFISGDAFDPSFLYIVPPFTAPPTTPAPTLSEVRTLNELRGHVSAISICLVFHLFDTEAAQLRLARALAGLLSPEPGSMILGMHVGLPEKGMRRGNSFNMFCHSPESWTEMWDGQVFEKGTVSVEARLVPSARLRLENGAVRGGDALHLEWTVTRL